MISTWHYVITGFLQNRGTRSRFVNLWNQLRDEHLKKDVAILLEPWNTAWDQQAEFIFRMSSARKLPTVRVYAYSWGAGWGAMRLAKELRERGLVVHSMVLSDPVYRHTYKLGYWRTLFHTWPINVPDNVRHVWNFYQRQNWPRGHELKTTERTVVESSVELFATHQNMDDQGVVIDKCLEVARL